MYCDMNMKTGKYDIIRYECGDLLLERNAPTERFVLIVTTNKIPQMRWGATRYFLFDENRPHVIYDATKEDMRSLFKYYMEPVNFYR